jgi:FtsH Extracellular
VPRKPLPPPLKPNLPVPIVREPQSGVAGGSLRQASVPRRLRVKARIMNNNPMMNNKTRFNVGYAIAAILAIFLIQYFFSAASQIAVIPYSEYQQLLKQGKVATVGISDRTLQGTLKEPLSGGQKQFLTTRVD